MYLGRSREHASNVSYILSPKTGHVSPKYPVLYNNGFSTITVTINVVAIVMWKGVYTHQPEFQLSLLLTLQILLKSTSVMKS